MHKVQNIHITLGDDPPQRLDKALASKAPEGAGLSRARLARLISGGGVLLAGQAITNTRYKARAGEVYEIVLSAPAPTDIIAEPLALDILHEDSELIVLNKPAGLVVHPAPGNLSGTLVNALIAHFGEELLKVGAEGRPGIVHRIDKGTSGLLVVAKTARAHQGLAAQFSAHTVERRYQALCYNVPQPGDPRLSGLRGVFIKTNSEIKITTLIGRHRVARQRNSVDFDRGKPACTHLRVEKNYGGAARVSCQLETGRTHQIRVHMHYIGHALIGDPLYAKGQKPALKEHTLEQTAIIKGFTRQALHAETLGFEHPVSRKKLRFKVAPPEDFQRLEAALCGKAVT